MTAERLDPDEVEAFRHARDEVLGRIDEAAARAGRDSALVTLVAVTKTVPADRVRAAVAAGFGVLGENRVQEGAAKIPLVDGAAWHLIGPLQANKARRALELFDVIESVHTFELAERLAALAAEDPPGRPVPVLLQVNVDRDPAKAGFDPDTVEAALDRLDGLPALDCARPHDDRPVRGHARRRPGRRSPPSATSASACGLAGRAWDPSCRWACPTTTRSRWRRGRPSSAWGGRSSATGRPRGGARRPGPDGQGPAAGSSG